MWTTIKFITIIFNIITNLCGYRIIGFIVLFIFYPLRPAGPRLETLTSCILRYTGPVNCDIDCRVGHTATHVGSLRSAPLPPPHEHYGPTSTWAGALVCSCEPSLWLCLSLAVARPLPSSLSTSFTRFYACVLRIISCSATLCNIGGIPLTVYLFLFFFIFYYHSFVIVQFCSIDVLTFFCVFLIYYFSDYYRLCVCLLFPSAVHFRMLVGQLSTSRVKYECRSGTSLFCRVVRFLWVTYLFSVWLIYIMSYTYTRYSTSLYSQFIAMKLAAIICSVGFVDICYHALSLWML